MIHKYNIDQVSITYNMDQIVIELHNLARALNAQQEFKKNNCDNSLTAAHDRLRIMAEQLSMITRDLKTASYMTSFRAFD